MLLARLNELGSEPGAWSLGGGTLLAKHWRHRRSFDLDITISTQGPTGRARRVLAAIAATLRTRGLEIDDDPENRLLRANAGRVNGYGNESGIDIWIHDADLGGPAETERIASNRIGSRLVPRLSTAQILHGKLQRDRQGLVRDAYDIAHARTRDASALEAAVNSITPKHGRRAEITFAARSLKMNEEPAALLGWNGEPVRDQRDCGLRAAHAIHDSRWIELEIETRGGRVHARTVNTCGEERDWLGKDGAGPEDAAARLDHAGILLQLERQYSAPRWTVQDVLDEISENAGGGRSARIVHTLTAARRGAATPRAKFTAEIPPEQRRVGIRPAIG